MIACRAIQGFVGGAMVPTVFRHRPSSVQGKKQALIRPSSASSHPGAHARADAGWLDHRCAVLALGCSSFNIVPGCSSPSWCRSYAASTKRPFRLRVSILGASAARPWFLGGLEYCWRRDRAWTGSRTPATAGVAQPPPPPPCSSSTTAFTHPRPWWTCAIFRNSRSPWAACPVSCSASAYSAPST